MTCFIKLDNDKENAGCVVTGRVCCNFTKSENIRGIELKFKGKEQNTWTEPDNDSFTTYTGKNKFLRVVNILQNGGNIGPGRFEYPFTFQLPDDVPGTYKGPFGKIAYSLKAKVDRPFSVDYTDKKRIVVVSLINFNLMKDQQLLEHVNYSIDNALGGCFCGSGYITMSVHVDKAAFVVAEVANVRVDINNMSSENVQSVSIKLERDLASMVTYPSKQKKSERKLLATMSDTGVEARGQRTYTFPLVIPEPKQFINFGLSKLFSQKTTLKVIANLDGCHRDMEVKLNITLGHIPKQDPIVSVSSP